MSDIVVLGLGLALVFGAVALSLVAVLPAGPARGGVAASLAQVERMTGLGPQAREAAFGERVLGPGMRRMATLADGLSPSGVAERLQRHLDLAGNPVGWTVDRALASKGVALLTGAGVGALLGARSGWGVALWVLGLGTAAFFVPDLLVWNKGLKRQEEITRTLPDALDMLTVSVEAGLGFDAALHQVARKTEGPLSGEFFRVLQEMQIGKARVVAFRAMGARCTAPDLRAFVAALVQADKLGIPIASVLREQAKEMRIKRRQRAEEQAQKIPIKILFPLLFFIFPAMFVVIIGPAVIGLVETFSGM